MNILLIGNFFSHITGAKGVSEEIFEHLRSLNWKIMTTSSYKARSLRLLDITTTIISQRHKFDLANIEVYSGNAFVLAEVACWLLRYLNKPFMLTLHGGNLPGFAKQYPKRVNRLLSNANLTITPSRYLQSELSRFRSDIHYLPNGVELCQYPFVLREQPRPKLCWLRAFHDIYNPTLAVDVVALLRNDFPDVHLTMIGSDRGDGSLEKAKRSVREKGLEQHVDIIGGISKIAVPSYLQQNDIYINTTRYESFGVAVMEAGALGLPIVTTEVGELSYLWTNTENAMLVPTDNAWAMAQAIKQILTEPLLAQRLSQNARKNAEQFDWSIILPAWKNLAIEALSNSPNANTRYK